MSLRATVWVPVFSLSGWEPSLHFSGPSFYFSFLSKIRSLLKKFLLKPHRSPELRVPGSDKKDTPGVRIAAIFVAFFKTQKVIMSRLVIFPSSGLAADSGNVQLQDPGTSIRGTVECFLTIKDGF